MTNKNKNFNNNLFFFVILILAESKIFSHLRGILLSSLNTLILFSGEPRAELLILLEPSKIILLLVGLFLPRTTERSS
jgi:hypothetical protein